MRLALLLILLPGPALAFCGGWDLPVAFGFDGGDWAARWAVLATLGGGVVTFSTLAFRRWARLRHLPEAL
ncbi:MAG: hypothetical protein ACU0CO_12405 [Shimia sp.]